MYEAYCTYVDDKYFDNHDYDDDTDADTDNDTRRSYLIESSIYQQA